MRTGLIQLAGLDSLGMDIGEPHVSSVLMIQIADPSRKYRTGYEHMFLPLTWAYLGQEEAESSRMRCLTQKRALERLGFLLVPNAGGTFPRLDGSNGSPRKRTPAIAQEAQNQEPNGSEVDGGEPSFE